TWELRTARGRDQLVAAESIAVHEDEGSAVAVVIPDLLRRTIEVEGVPDDLVGPTEHDVDASHVRLPARAPGREVLIGVLDPLIERVPRLVLRRLRRGIATLPEGVPVGPPGFLALELSDLVDLLLRGDIAEHVHGLGGSEPHRRARLIHVEGLVAPQG